MSAIVRVDGDEGRHRHVLARAVGGSLLDVGCWDGAFLDLAHASGRFSRLAGVDDKEPVRSPDPRHRHKDEAGPFPLATDRYEGYHLDAESMPFADGEFDTVVAMELLEHQPDGKMERVLAELRRVAGRRLLVTVPFAECWPSRVRSHVQRFMPERVDELFAGEKTVLYARGRSFPWVLVVEERA